MQPFSIAILDLISQVHLPSFDNMLPNYLKDSTYVYIILKISDNCSFKFATEIFRFIPIFICSTSYEVGRCSSGGIATGYGLDGPGIKYSLLFTFELVGCAERVVCCAESESAGVSFLRSECGVYECTI
jgi:hypothetical protein